MASTTGGLTRHSIDTWDVDLWATAMLGTTTVRGVRIQAHGMKNFGTANLQEGIMAVSEYLDESPLAQRGAVASKL